jgi:hypothetical protein
MLAVIDDVDTDLELPADNIRNGVLDPTRECRTVMRAAGFSGVQCGRHAGLPRQAADVRRENSVVASLHCHILPWFVHPRSIARGSA